MAEGLTVYSGTNYSVQLKERQPSFMQSCCGEARCFKNFLDLEDRIKDSDPEQLFRYVHKSVDDIVVTSTSHNLKCTEFMKDVWDYRTHEDFANDYVTDVNVNTYGSNKVYACWHILDRYRGHYLNRNLTRNMVDIKVTVPEMNIVFEEHFCFKYFACSKGSPYSLVPEIMKGAVCKIYNRYYEDQSYENVKERIHFTCIYCQHDEEEGPSKLMVKDAIPEWYMKEIYKSGGNKVNDYIILILIVVF